MLGRIEQAEILDKEPKGKETNPINQNRSSGPWEYVITGLVSLTVAILFAKVGRGGPNSSDVELYLNLGLSGLKDTFVLNRYFHIFVQQIFVGSASTPLEGYHNFWGFQMGLTTFLIYFSARNVLKRSNFLNGILAVLIFFSITAIAKLSGVVVVDFSAMTMTLLITTVYLISVKHEHAKPWVIALMGLLFFLGFKTKETVLPVGILFLGLGWSEGKPFSIRKLLANLVWVICGLFSGVVLFGVLSWIILGDPFFGLRISEWQEFLGTYAVHPTSALETVVTEDGALGSWYQRFWFAELLLPFVLYLFSGIKSSEDSIIRRLLWVVPLFYTVFLVVTINNSLGYIDRFGLPAMPIISLLAAQIIDLQIPEARPDRRKFFISLAIGGIVVVVIRLLMWASLPGIGLKLTPTVKFLYYPIILSLLLASLILFPKVKKVEAFNFLIILSLLSFPLASNLMNIFIERQNERIFSEAVLPFSEFQEQITFTPDMTFYATKSALSSPSLAIMKNVDEVLSLFNFYFDATATRANFDIVEDDLQLGEDLTEKPYDYVLLTGEEWDRLENADNFDSAVLSHYQIHYGSGGRLILFTSE
jgi:hypothetical protein